MALYGKAAPHIAKNYIAAPFALKKFLAKWDVHRESTPLSLRPYFDAIKTNYEQCSKGQSVKYLFKIAPKCIKYVKSQVDAHTIEPEIAI
jgi:hypothetical protein